jgi:hypothetical protein
VEVVIKFFEMGDSRRQCRDDKVGSSSHKDHDEKDVGTAGHCPAMLQTRKRKEEGILLTLAA